MKALTLICDIFRKFPLLLSANILLLLVANLLGIVSIFSIAPIIDFITNPEMDNASFVTQKVETILEHIGLPITLGSFLALFLISQLLKNGFRILAQHSLIRTKYVMVRDLMLGTFEDLFQSRWLFFCSKKQGMLLNSFTREMNMVGDAFAAMANFFSSILQFIFYVLASFFVSWQVTSISLGSALILAFPFFFLGKLAYRLGKQGTSTANEMNIVLQESIGAAKLILGFGNQKKNLESLTHAFDIHRQAAVKVQTLKVATPLAYEPLGGGVIVIAFLTAQRFSIPLSEIAVILWALRSGIPSIGNIAAGRNALMNFFPSFEQVRNLREEARNSQLQPGCRIFNGFDKGIRVENLSFAYPGCESTLKNINLHIMKGNMVTFVGESGSGKSTLIDLIMGFDVPQVGQIIVDDVALDNFDINSYRQKIGFVPQDCTLFNMTIRDNLCWAKENADDKELEEACRQAHAHEFIEELPEGYDTLVGDSGVRLSGGQRQRLALARAILRKPELLILDEATSSLDSQSERVIQQAIESLAKRITIIVIAHRLSTIVNADYVYVLHKGQIIEEGTYKTLVAQNGHFRHMTQFQMLEPVS